MPYMDGMDTNLLFFFPRNRGKKKRRFVSGFADYGRKRAALLGQYLGIIGINDSHVGSGSGA